MKKAQVSLEYLLIAVVAIAVVGVVFLWTQGTQEQAQSMGDNVSDKFFDDVQSGSQLCSPDCSGKSCGDDDGCGALCTNCQPGYVCDTDWTCKIDSAAVLELCGESECSQADRCEDLFFYDYPETCINELIDGECSNCICAASIDDCGDRGCSVEPCRECICDAEMGGCNELLSPDGVECELEGETGFCNDGSCCVASCVGRECGSDGCGGSCGSCPSGESCSNGQCGACVPDCVGRECGSDGCSGTCGSCDSDESCGNGMCLADDDEYWEDDEPSIETCCDYDDSSNSWSCTTESPVGCVGSGCAVGDGYTTLEACLGSDTCEPKSCAELGYSCGNWDDECGGIVECGICGEGQVCSGGVCGLPYDLAVDATVVTKQASNGAYNCEYDSTETYSALSLRCCLNRAYPCDGFTDDPVAEYAVDENSSSFWCSGESFRTGDSDWVYVDLGETHTITQVRINSLSGTPYACSYPRDYEIQSSLDCSFWTTEYSAVDDRTRIKDVTFDTPISARCIRLYTTRVHDNTGWRLSVRDFEIYGA
jgi:hypothetical protein